MKFSLKISLIILSLFFLISCHHFFGQEEFSLKRTIAFKMASEIIDDLREDDSLFFCGISEAAPAGKYTKIGLSFSSSKILSKEEGRRLILKCLHKMLEKFNGNIEFSQYIENGKFKANDLGVSIYVQPEDGLDVYYPHIITFSFFTGKLWYFTEAPNVRGYYTEEKESYEEALRLANEISIP